MITLEQLQRWLAGTPEGKHLEFKEAKQQFDSVRLLKYCVALANEGGGHLVLGVSDKPPRRVVNTQAFQNLADTKTRILDALRLRVDIHELHHPDGRVLVLEVPARPAGQPLHLDGAYWMRSGEDLVPMTPDQLRRIFAEGAPGWLDQTVKVDATADEVIGFLDTQAWFDLMHLPYPTTRDGVLTRLQGEQLISAGAGGCQRQTFGSARPGRRPCFLPTRSLPI